MQGAPPRRAARSHGGESGPPARASCPVCLDLLPSERCIELPCCKVDVCISCAGTMAFSFREQNHKCPFCRKRLQMGIIKADISAAASKGYNGCGSVVAASAESESESKSEPTCGTGKAAAVTEVDADLQKFVDAISDLEAVVCEEQFFARVC